MAKPMKTSTAITTATGSFEIRSWDEQPYAELEGAPRLTNARVTAEHTGDIDGERTASMVMCYRSDQEATYVGFERVTGSLGGRTGSFVLQSSGAYVDGAATTTWSVVPGSATGELAGLRGEGGYVAQHGEGTVSCRLDYHFE